MEWKNFKDIIGKPIRFATVEGIAKYSLWKDSEKRYVKWNEEITIEGLGTFKFDSKNFDKNSDAFKADKVYTCSEVRTRELVVDGENVMCDVKQSIEIALETLSKTLDALDLDITQKEFMISDSGSGTDRYTIELLKESPKSVESTPMPPIETKTEMLDPELAGLSDIEKTVYDSYVKFIKDKGLDVKSESTKTAILAGMTTNKIPEDRAQEIYTQYFLPL